jgi:alpha-1,3-glucosyltransferase
VHEKSILLPLLPVTMMATSQPEGALWGPLVAAFSMYPLLERDGAAGVYVACCALYLILVSALTPPAGGGRAAGSSRRSSRELHIPAWLPQAAPFAAAGLCVLCHGMRLLPAPSQLPWLWDRLHVTVAWLPITAHMLYLNWRQYQQAPGQGRQTAAEWLTHKRQPPVQ